MGELCTKLALTEEDRQFILQEVDRERRYALGRRLVQEGVLYSSTLPEVAVFDLESVLSYVDRMAKREVYVEGHFSDDEKISLLSRIPVNKRVDNGRILRYIRERMNEDWWVRNIECIPFVLAAGKDPALHQDAVAIVNAYVDKEDVWKIDEVFKFLESVVVLDGVHVKSLYDYARACIREGRRQGLVYAGRLLGIGNVPEGFRESCLDAICQERMVEHVSRANEEMSQWTGMATLLWTPDRLNEATAKVGRMLIKEGILAPGTSDERAYELLRGPARKIGGWDLARDIIYEMAKSPRNDPAKLLHFVEELEKERLPWADYFSHAKLLLFERGELDIRIPLAQLDADLQEKGKRKREDVVSLVHAIAQRPDVNPEYRWALLDRLRIDERIEVLLLQPSEFLASGSEVSLDVLTRATAKWRTVQTRSRAEKKLRELREVLKSDKVRETEEREAREVLEMLGLDDMSKNTNATAALEDKPGTIKQPLQELARSSSPEEERIVREKEQQELARLATLELAMEEGFSAVDAVWGKMWESKPYYHKDDVLISAYVSRSANVGRWKVLLDATLSQGVVCGRYVNVADIFSAIEKNQDLADIDWVYEKLDFFFNSKNAVAQEKVLSAVRGLVERGRARWDKICRYVEVCFENGRLFEDDRAHAWEHDFRTIVHAMPKHLEIKYLLWRRRLPYPGGSNVWEYHGKSICHLIVDEKMIEDGVCEGVRTYLAHYPLSNESHGSIAELVADISAAVVGGEDLEFGHVGEMLAQARALQELVECASVRAPGYIVLRREGEGASAKVYLVKSEKAGLQNTRYALKVFNKGKENEQEFANADRLLAIPGQYRGHFLPVVPVASVMYQGKPVTAFLMPYGGKTLREVMSKKWMPRDIVDVGRQLVDVVKGLISVREVHGDLRPDNLFIDDKGWVTIGDYGIVTPSREYDFKYNRRYGAPREYVGISPDFFSVGLILHEMCTGEHLILPRGADDATTKYAPEVERAINSEYDAADFEEKYRRKISDAMAALLNNDFSYAGWSVGFELDLPGESWVENHMEELSRDVHTISKIIEGTILSEGEFADPIETEVRKQVRARNRQGQEE